MSKRRKLFLASVLVVLFLFLGIIFSIPKLGGNFNNDSSLRSLSSDAYSLLNESYKGLDPDLLRDYHVHIAGLGKGNSGCYVNSKMTSVLHPLENLKFSIYKSASGINNDKSADQDFLFRLIRLMRDNPKHGKLCMMAFDRNYDREGNINEDKTEFYVPNEYVWKICQNFPGFFIPCISVHPYRKDALQELRKWAELGVKQVKWLPNAMGMDPSDSRCDSFYLVMKKYDMVLLSHAGHEKAVHAEDDQRFGNPLLMRRPLNMGVKVIMAHCASLGENPDLDAADKKMTNNFDLFLRMMNDKSYEGLLFGDISAMTQYNRLGNPMKVILGRADLHHRLVNGSDYPLPAINALIRTKDLQEQGYITEQERENLNEIYKVNPLIFDFVLKRTIRDPQNKSLKLSDCIFQKNEKLGY
jgi:uncharacterized protein